MTNIRYTGINPECIDLINSEEFRAVLTAHPALSLITVAEANEYVKEQYYKVELPLPEGYDEPIAVIDVDDRGSFMWVTCDGFGSVEDPNPAFIAILKIMDNFSVETWDERIFTPLLEERLYADHPEILASTFDFTTGEYLRNPKPTNNLNDTPKDENMSEPDDVEIMYVGYNFYNYDFINSQGMKDFIAKHDHLKIVTETGDPVTGEDILKELTFPIMDAHVDGRVMILDTRLDEADYENHALLINHEDDAFAVNPSPEFIEVLKMMQADYAQHEQELFVDMSSDDCEDERWNWEFDFTTGKYIRPDAA